MNKLKKRWGSFRYQLLLLFFNWVAVNLPISYRGGGGFAQSVRLFIGKRLFKSCGQQVNVERGVLIEQPWLFEIGDNSGVGVNCYIDGPVTIGCNVMMGPQTTIYRRNHSIKETAIPMMKQGFESFQPLLIEDDVWIGGHVIVVPSVKKIGQGSVIAAGTVVVKDVLPYEVVGGNPGRLIKNRSNKNDK